MTRRLLARIFAGWALTLAIACVAVHSWARIAEAPMPRRDAQRWALRALEEARLGREVPRAPASAQGYRAAGPIFVTAWSDGRPIARHETEGDLASAVVVAAEAFATHPVLTHTAGWTAPRGDARRTRFTIEIARGDGPVFLAIPYLSSLGLVPLREGIVAELEGRRAYITPEELRSEGAYEAGVPTPLPDLSFGVAIDRLVDRLARELGAGSSELLSRGSVRRLRCTTITDAWYPRSQRVTERALRDAAVDGARFLLRHQRPDGHYTYVYDARAGRERPDVYNMPRHAGTTYFLAQVHHLHGLPEARSGALRALRWAERFRIARCGGDDVWCVASGPAHADVGSAALLAIAAAELLETGDDAAVRRMLEGLTAFLRSLQRPDGELMHEYDIAAQRPIDVQHMYYSGEAALALLKAHRVLGDRRDLDAARKLMRHLTGAGWSFFGSRYYYGEEHWTCISAGEGYDRAERADRDAGLDFCLRWAGFNREIQYREGQTQWPVSGAYGVGPLILPRLTPVASRTEAFISTYEMATAAGREEPELRAQIERGLGMLLRWQWRPGPAHLFRDPAGALGGLPGSPADLTVRNDFVQHACSAMVRWADRLRRENEAGSGR